MYFERRKYKNFSLRQLKGRWGIPILVTLVTFLITILFYIPDFVKAFSSSTFEAFLNSEFIDFSEYLDAYEQLTQSSMLSSLVQSIIETILVIAALNLYLKMSRSPEKVGFGAFIEGLNNWWRAILCYLYKLLFITLWMFCFFIPAIIKAYAYSMMEYLVAEFPSLSIPDAMNISKKITNGSKWDLFIMELSFLGWELLGALSLGIGYIWIIPYRQMTYVNAYHALLKNALEHGLIKPEDLQ